MLPEQVNERHKTNSNFVISCVKTVVLAVSVTNQAAVTLSV